MAENGAVTNGHLTPEIIQSLREQNPGARLHKLAHDGVEIVVRSPDSALWRKFRTKQSDERQSLDAGVTLVRDCLLWPDQAALTAYLNDRPGLDITFANTMVDLAGMAKAAEVTPL